MALSDMSHVTNLKLGKEVHNTYDFHPPTKQLLIESVLETNSCMYNEPVIFRPFLSLCVTLLIVLAYISKTTSKGHLTIHNPGECTQYQWKSIISSNAESLTKFIKWPLEFFFFKFLFL